MDSYKVNELQKMLAHETSDSEEHYGARLSHWYGDTNHLTIDAGGIRALIRYYSEHDTDLGAKTITHDGDTFELVDHVPSNYHIWNIGRNMVDGYLPLCQLAAPQPFLGGRSIRPDTLKAIKCDGAQTILAAIGYGPETPDQMEKYIKRYSKEGPGGRHALAVERMKKALPLMREIKWEGR